MAQFTPNTTLQQSPESDWTFHLASVGWSDHVVFTKESLVDFLKTKGIQVSPSFKELQSLPEYATVGKFDRDPAGSGGGAKKTQQPAAPAVTSNQGPKIQPLAGVVDASGKPYRPNYKVTEPMGGGSAAVSAIFAGDDDEGNRWAAQPPRRAPAPPVQQQQEQRREEEAPRPVAQRSVSGASADDGSYRPTTRVTMPGGTGGTSSITLG
ncbi:hypothetical protein A4X13_0g5301 [Tilletia indica]|uniref:Uncharacterized protein n=1 Tax=Tilletia indica TaxID=43049 RepID=A0A177THV0_9BASI|nr:hypothetical protein A4X13_0g5301 [Tilletia indica]